MILRNAGMLAIVAILARAAPVETLLDTGYRQMYNLDFDAAHHTFAEYEHAHPDDPFGVVSDAAAYLFSEFDRLHVLSSQFALNDENFFTTSKPLAADPAIKRLFESELNKARELAAAGLRQSPPDPNAMLAVTMSYGLHADYLALIEKREFAALAEIKQARNEAEKLLSLYPTYYDAWIAVALENYLLSLKPAPVRWFLHVTGSQTNRQKGLDKLRLTAEKGRYLAPYARVLLAIAALRDHNSELARQYLQRLAAEFPGNPLYRQELARVQ
jgi:hypothetical protein